MCFELNWHEEGPKEPIIKVVSLPTRTSPLAWRVKATQGAMTGLSILILSPVRSQDQVCPEKKDMPPNCHGRLEVVATDTSRCFAHQYQIIATLNRSHTKLTTHQTNHPNPSCY